MTIPELESKTSRVRISEGNTFTTVVTEDETSFVVISRYRLTLGDTFWRRDGRYRRTWARTRTVMQTFWGARSERGSRTVLCVLVHVQNRGLFRDFCR